MLDPDPAGTAGTWMSHAHWNEKNRVWESKGRALLGEDFRERRQPGLEQLWRAQTPSAV